MWSRSTGMRASPNRTVTSASSAAGAAATVPISPPVVATRSFFFNSSFPFRLPRAGSTNISTTYSGTNTTSIVSKPPPPKPVSCSVSGSTGVGTSASVPGSSQAGRSHVGAPADAVAATGGNGGSDNAAAERGRTRTGRAL